jgi:hypothetical protein
VFEGRDPEDPTSFLNAVADGLRPNEVEIHVRPEDLTAEQARPDEQLETKAREHAERALDRKARKQRAARKSSPMAVEPPKATLPEKLGRVRAFVDRLVAQGWKITLKVLPVAERLAKMYKDLHGMG